MASVIKRLGVLAAMTALLLLPAVGARAGTVPSGFQEKAVMTGFTEPTSVVFSPDGRVFVAEKSGVIKVFDSISDTSAETFADLSNEVYNYWDRGLLGMVLDPEFPAKPYIYVLYTRDALPGGSVPKWGGTSLGDSCPNPPGATLNGCVATGRLSKLTASGNSMSAETPLITDWCQQFPSHSIGSLAFGSDGDLYVSGGEGASFNYADWGQTGNPCGDPPGGSMTPPTAEGGSLRSQDVRTPGDPTGLDGALLRVNPETGQGVAGNPFEASSDANARRILAYGLRNPFRFTIRPGTSEPWVGDVGNSTWEEIDRVDSTSAHADNFGWPCYEGDNVSSARAFEWDSANLNLCESLYNEGPTAVTAPYYSYNHSAKVVPGETCGVGSSSISGLTFYKSGPFPNAYNGALFFADYSRGCIWAMMPGANGLPNPSNIQTFDAGAGGPVNLTVGPEGSLYFPDLNHGDIWRISHTVGNQPPVAKATATPQNGPAPLSVQLSASGSSDPDPGDTLSYSWDLNGDGVFGDSTAVSPTHVYSEAGTYVATVRVSDPDGATDTDSVSIQANNTPPTATIASPSSSLTWAVGDQIAFSGTATDAEDGTLPASAYKWRVIVHHCPSNCHLHQIEEVSGVKSGVVVAPDHEYPSFLEIQLTVTDSGGLTATKSAEIQPQTVSISTQTLPVSGFGLAVDGVSTISPASTTVIKGSNNTISAPPQTLNGTSYEFGAWSDGGAATHNVTADHNLSLTAVMGPPGPPTIAEVSPKSPANNNSPVVKGSVGSDFPTTVALFKSSTCSGTAVATGSAAEFAAGLSVAVNDDTVTSFTARATDAAGNASACSGAFSYTEDSTAPGAPTTLATTPPSPANDNEPEVRGSAGAGSPSSIKVFASPDCSGTPVTASVATFTGAGTTVTVPDDQTSSFSARAVDAAGNESSCSSAISYTEDSTAPAAPSSLASIPASPANQNSPKISGSAEGGSTVRLYLSANCSGTALATGSAAEFSAGMTVTVSGDTTTSITAKASDAAGNASACSGALSYVEDSTAPATPTILGTAPTSPASDNNPKVRGSAESGSTVRLYLSANCTGTPAATGTATEFGSGLAVAVTDNTTSSVTARATDAAGNASACSSPVSYVEDSAAPAAPTGLTTSPASPGNNNSPKILGSAESGSTVAIFKSATCSGSAVATGSAAEFAVGVAVTVADDSVTSFTAKATDGVGNASACSAAIAYTEDSTLPEPPTIDSTLPASPANDNAPKVRGTVAAGTTARIYASSDCSGATAATGSAAEFAAGLSVSVGSDRTTQLTVRATDGAGNVSACSQAFAYTEDSTAPAAPSGLTSAPASPANQNSPKISGSAEGGSTVALFKSASCSGTAAATGSAAEFAAGLTVTIADDTSTSLTARATDAAGNTSPCSQALVYSEDSTPPAAPTILATTLPSPANDNEPEVRGSAGAGSPTSIEVFTASGCTGTVVTSSVANFTGGGIAVTVPGNQTTSLSARAVDAAGNASACSGAFSYTEDSTAPAAPTGLAVSPASPANDNAPELRGSAESGATVQFFASTNCSGQSTASGSAAAFATGITVAVANDSSTSFTARAIDAAGNASACSGAVSYTEDSTPPAAPSITSTSPASPANVDDPEVFGNAESGAAVQIYISANCSGQAAASGSAAEFAAGLNVTVADDAATSLTARATDSAGNESACSPALVYIEDSTLPEAPEIEATVPASPANDNSPVVAGSAPAGSTVRIYETADCAGPVAATGSGLEFAAGLRLTAPVGDDSTTQLSATATDAAQNVSPCSQPSAYTEDSTAPAAPLLSATSPPSPANDNRPVVAGSAESGATVHLYETADCSGPVAASGSAAEFGAGLTVAVADDTTTALSATATDTAANVSACSAPLSYTEDSTPPAAPTIDSSVPGSPANFNNPRLSGRAEGGATVLIYESPGCTGPVAATGSAGEFAAGLMLPVADDTVTSFSAVAADPVGNPSGCSSPLRYTEDSTAPQTSISRAPAARVVALGRRGGRRTKTVRASFSFNSNDDTAHFLCQVDDAPFAPCASPLVRGKFKLGSHRFAVYAVDPAGNIDPTPASRRFRLVPPRRAR